MPLAIIPLEREGKRRDEEKVLGRESLVLQCETGGIIVVAIDLLRFSQG
jgi:hypothetical protein